MNALENKIIISTRPISKNDSIKNHLTEKGATVLDFPMIEICPNDLNESIKTTLQKINSYQWIVFTSKNGVEYFFKYLNSLNIHSENISAAKIAVIGKETSEEVLKNKCTPFLISSGNTSEDLLKEISEKIKTCENVLFAIGELAGNTLEKGLSEIANITRINVYKTIRPNFISKDIIERIKNDNYNIIIFTSPSGFMNFKIIMNEHKIFSEFRVACIGKTTEKEILKYTCNPFFVSSKTDGEIFVKELGTFFKTN